MDVDWISTLQTRAARMRLKLVYSESVTGVKHRLVHVVDVHVENVADLKATGRGSKKKVAKHTAAKALYALLQDKIDRQTASKATKSKPYVLDNKPKGTDREASECEESQPDPDDCTETPRSQEHHPQQSENHIGQLQEICQQNKWPLPKYNFCFTEGPRRYACQCQLTIPLDIHACDDDCAVDATTDRVYTELHGTADSKGEAKQAAAGNTLLWLYGHKLI
ncbi:RISC-loading complex subunit TARBP2-like [Oreochromis niloticus]|uniref:RISC-loading complex subunit TARBP2-like n=1 Tax=Oreochromis niloticus TaxID=8128 RepID=UPI000DF2170A|nr:RISC-loading complex subunit TARBP2-like [Oreochromis niloticus]